VDAMARGLEAGAECRHRRALAVGAGDMDHRRQPALGMIQRREQPLDAVEREIDELRMELAKALQDPIAAQAVAPPAGRGSSGTTGGGGARLQRRSRTRASVS